LLWCAVLVFFGVLTPRPRSDLNIVEVERQSDALSIAISLACISSVFAGAFGRVQVSIFWGWFAVTFGATCLVPWWPSKGGDLLPFATPYVNYGFRPEHLVMLAGQCAVSFVVATAITGFLKMLRRLAHDGESESAESTANV